MLIPQLMPWYNTNRSRQILSDCICRDRIYDISLDGGRKLNLYSVITAGRRLGWSGFPHPRRNPVHTGGSHGPVWA